MLRKESSIVIAIVVAIAIPVVPSNHMEFSNMEENCEKVMKANFAQVSPCILEATNISWNVLQRTTPNEPFLNEIFEIGCNSWQKIKKCLQLPNILDNDCWSLDENKFSAATDSLADLFCDNRKTIARFLIDHKNDVHTCLDSYAEEVTACFTEAAAATITPLAVLPKHPDFCRSVNVSQGCSAQESTSECDFSFLVDMVTQTLRQVSYVTGCSTIPVSPANGGGGDGSQFGWGSGGGGTPNGGTNGGGTQNGGGNGGGTQNGGGNGGGTQNGGGESQNGGGTQNGWGNEGETQNGGGESQNGWGNEGGTQNGDGNGGGTKNEGGIGDGSQSGGGNGGGNEGGKTQNGKGGSQNEGKGSGVGSQNGAVGEGTGSLKIVGGADYMSSSYFLQLTCIFVARLFICISY